MGQQLSTFWAQTFSLPAPTLTEKELPDQTGKVHIITGGYTGVGLALASILYQNNATVYLAGRSQSKASTAISHLKTTHPSSRGRIHFLLLDLADLSTIKPAVSAFLKKESRLDVLLNNAGLMRPPRDSKSAQGYEAQAATNIYGPWLLTRLLQPLMVETAKESERGSVRVAWAASIAVDVASPVGGLQFQMKDGVEIVSEDLKIEPYWYGQSKSANVMLGVEAARRWGGDGIISTSFNPGNLRTELARHQLWLTVQILKLITYPPVFGAYTELFAGWSPALTAENNGDYIIPWGRVGSYNADLQKAIKPKSEGGEGKAEKLWEVCEKVCAPYM